MEAVLEAVGPSAQPAEDSTASTAGAAITTPMPSLPSAVHVEACNQPAAALYLSSGFDVETEESENTARALNRNRRLLLHRRL